MGVMDIKPEIMIVREFFIGRIDPDSDCIGCADQITFKLLGKTILKPLEFQFGRIGC